VGKFLITIAVVMAILWLVRGSRPGAARRKESAPRSAAGERMVPCAHCGVYLPVGEAIASGERHYCCEEHRRRSA